MAQRQKSVADEMESLHRLDAASVNKSPCRVKFSRVSMRTRTAPRRRVTPICAAAAAQPRRGAATAAPNQGGFQQTR